MFPLVSTFHVERGAIEVQHGRVVDDQQAEDKKAQGIDIVTAGICGHGRGVRRSGNAQHRQAARGEPAKSDQLVGCL